MTERTREQRIASGGERRRDAQAEPAPLPGGSTRESAIPPPAAAPGNRVGHRTALRPVAPDRPDAGYRYPRGGFFRGIAHVFDISGSLAPYAQAVDGPAADAAALASDWVMVGNDLRTALLATPGACEAMAAAQADDSEVEDG